MPSIALAAALGLVLPAVAAETAGSAPGTGAPEATGSRAADAAEKDRIAQFTLPGARPAPGGGAPTAPAPQVLKFEYVYGSEFEFPYVNNRDLNRKVHDRDLTVSPTFFGAVTYRPTNWLDTRLEGTLSRLYPLKQEKVTFLPGAEDEPVYRNDKRRPSLLIDQAFAKVKPPGMPFEVTVGRENFEDRRLWLYDAALDTIHLKTNVGDFHLDAFLGQENFRDLDLLSTLPQSNVTYYTLYGEYRGIEDHQFAVYMIDRRDREENRDPAAGLYTGRPRFMGVRAMGRPSDSFNYWADYGIVRGIDENTEKFQGYGMDVGGTYRFPSLPMQPSVTLGYAFGSGDSTPTPGDGKNKQFRQTGIQSNEARFGGVTQFKRYGEFFDPELNNIQIFTAGVGARPAGWFFIDLVYHHYKMAEPVPANGFTSAGGVTAEVNVVNGRSSKELGQEVDLILGFRNLFGIRSLGAEVRAGLFYPGRAYLTPNPDTGNFLKHPDKGISGLFVFFF